jgi:MerR family transcriptional regulator, thiopeptide resistance regulator
MTMEAEASEARRVGDIAAAAGLTVRTLHYYEEIGLLVPSARSDAGHRLYGDADVERLYQICLLRSLGLPLAEIERALDDPGWDLRSGIAEHLRRLERRISRESGLRARLNQLLSLIDEQSREHTAALVQIIEEMSMLETSVHHRISTLVYSDLEGAHAYLVRVFGLGPGELTRDDEGHVVHAELQAGDGVVWLHAESEEFGLSSPRSIGVTTSSVAVLVDDVDAHFERARDEGAEIIYEPIDQPYGYREYSARDFEGHLWSFMRPIDRAET